MNRKDLTEAIAEGILQGVFRILFYFMIIFLVIAVVIIGLTFYSNYIENNCTNNGTCQPVSVASPNCFPFKNLNCHVVIGNETETSNIWYFGICGYQEANAYYEQIKAEIEYARLKNSSWEIKWLKCD